MAVVISSYMYLLYNILLLEVELSIWLMLAVRLLLLCDSCLCCYYYSRVRTTRVIRVCSVLLRRFLISFLPFKYKRSK